MTKKSKSKTTSTQRRKEKDNGHGQTNSREPSFQTSRGKIRAISGDGVTEVGGIELGDEKSVGNICGGGQDRAVSKFVWCDNQKGMIPKCVCDRDRGKWMKCKKCAYRKM